MSGAGLGSALLVIVGMLNIVLALALLIFTDRGLAPIQLIGGCVMLALGLLNHAQLKGPAMKRAVPDRRPARPPLVRALSALGLVLVLAGVAWARVELRQGPASDEFEAPAIEASYQYLGHGGKEMQVGLDREEDRASWRVNSDGTNNCRPAGNSALWNFVSGAATVDSRGRLRSSGTYFSSDPGLDGKRYEKEVAYRLRGRFTAPGGARGTFWRRDRFYVANELRFECTRSGRWTASAR